MTHRVREVTEDQCQWIATDLAALDHEFARVLSRHQGLAENVWLGGDRDADNTEKGPVRITKAIDLIRKARDLIREADHEVAMFRATGDP
jgi:hypothetical protein